MFSDFVFIIRLIRLGFSFQESKKIPVFELTNYWFPVRSQNHYTTELLWVGDKEKLSVTFCHAWLILVEFI